MTTAILIGGKSSRMGTDKAGLPVIGGGNMRTVLADRFSVLGEVLFSVDRIGHFPCDGYRQVADRYPGAGPINGLFAAFSEGDAECALLMATDMPYADPALARRLEQELGSYEACTVLRSNGRVEPLFAVYSRHCLAKAEECISEGDYSMRAVLAKCSVKHVNEESLSEFDLNRILLNINTQKDYERYLHEADVVR